MDLMAQLLSWVNSLAEAESDLKEPLASKAGKVDSGYFVGTLAGPLIFSIYPSLFQFHHLPRK